MVHLIINLHSPQLDCVIALIKMMLFFCWYNKKHCEYLNFLRMSTFFFLWFPIWVPGKYAAVCPWNRMSFGKRLLILRLSSRPHSTFLCSVAQCISNIKVWMTNMWFYSKCFPWLTARKMLAQIANALELHLSRTNPWKWCYPVFWSICDLGSNIK